MKKPTQQVQVTQFANRFGNIDHVPEGCVRVFGAESAKVKRSGLPSLRYCWVEKVGRRYYPRFRGRVLSKADYDRLDYPLAHREMRAG